MKKKYSTEGRPYLFSTDDFLEGLCIAIVSNIHKVEQKELMTMEEKLWEASYIYLENCDDDSAVFTHTMLGITTTQNDMIQYWIKEAIKVIMSYIPIKEKKVKLEWGKTYKTPHKILVRETKDGKFISLKTFVNGIIMSHADFDNFIKDLGIDLDELTFVQFNKLEHNIRITLGVDKYFDKYKTLRCFTESLIVEKELETKTAVSNRKYDVDRGFYTENDFNEISSIFTIV